MKRPLPWKRQRDRRPAAASNPIDVVDRRFRRMPGKARHPDGGTASGASAEHAQAREVGQEPAALEPRRAFRSRRARARRRSRGASAASPSGARRRSARWYAERRRAPRTGTAPRRARRRGSARRARRLRSGRCERLPAAGRGSQRTGAARLGLTRSRTIATLVVPRWRQMRRRARAASVRGAVRPLRTQDALLGAQVRLREVDRLPAGSGDRHLGERHVPGLPSASEQTLERGIVHEPDAPEPEPRCERAREVDLEPARGDDGVVRAHRARLKPRARQVQRDGEDARRDGRRRRGARGASDERERENCCEQGSHERAKTVTGVPIGVKSYSHLAS